MLPLRDAQLRVVLLHHLTAQLANASPQELRSVGVSRNHLVRLRQLSALELSRLAGMRGLTLGVAIEPTSLSAGLRAVALMNEARALEEYFIRHGASCRLMSTLFKMHRLNTLRRRRNYGVSTRVGRLRLPDHAKREHIFHTWHAIRDPNPRARYYQLHQVFPEHPLSVLETVVREYEDYEAR